MGFASRKTMLRQMSAKELVEWEAFYLLEPFGEYQTNYAAGVVASTMANIHRKKGAKGFVPDDFMPKRGSVYVSKKQSVEQQALILRSIASVSMSKRKHKKKRKKRKKRKE